jgi:spermidine synthase
MYKYQGRLIYQSHDEDGILEVIEKNGVRSLHFGSSSRQSSMLLTDPDRLELSYVRAMTSWMLFKKTWDEALLIGLGGGSLAKFLLYHFPACRLRIVEYRQSVVKIARSHFGLPFDSRLKIIINDGSRYVGERSRNCVERYDLLMVDAFDHDGLAPAINNPSFFAACQSLLNPEGVLIINLWGGLQNPVFQQVAKWLAELFNWRLLFLPVRNRGNIIVLAFNDIKNPFALKDLRQRAAWLQAHYDIEFPVFLKDFGSHNASTFKHLVSS